MEWAAEAGPDRHALTGIATNICNQARFAAAVMALPWAVLGPDGDPAGFCGGCHTMSHAVLPYAMTHTMITQHEDCAGST